MTQLQLPGRIPVFDLGDRLRKAREFAGLSQVEIATELGISRRSVVAYEATDRNVPRTVVISWALRTGVDLAWLEGADTPRYNASVARRAHVQGMILAGGGGCDAA